MSEGIRFDLTYGTMPWHKADAVVFDIGNVLVRYAPTELAARIFPGDGEKQRHMVERVYGGPQWQEVDRGALGFEEAARQLAGDGEYPYEDYLRAFRTALELAEPVEEGWRAAARCRRAGKRLFVLSNYSLEGYRVLLERFGARFSLFDGEVISSHELLLKPEPAIYDTLLRRYALDAGRTLFIDDMLANVEGAMRAGIHGFHMNESGKMDRFFV